MAKQSCREHASVVQYQPVARVEKLRQPAEHGVLDGTCASVEHQQTRLTALSRRMLSHELLRELEIKVRDAHGNV